MEAIAVAVLVGVEVTVLVDELASVFDAVAVAVLLEVGV